MHDVEISREDGVLNIVFSRPEKSNSLTNSVVESLIEILTESRIGDTVLAVFSGQGENFCAGLDLSDVETSTDAELLYRVVRIETLLQVIYHAPFPTLALAHGRVVGAGSDLVCACSHRVAAPDTMFLMPGLRFGVALGIGRLTQRIGANATRYLLMESEFFDTASAHRLGFISDVVPVDKWASIKTQTKRRALILPTLSTAELLSITCPDTRAEDMASLVSSAGKPGLQRRIIEYKRSISIGRNSIENT